MAVETTSAPSLAAADNLTRRLPSFGRVDTSTLPTLGTETPLPGIPVVRRRPILTPARRPRLADSRG